MHDHKSAEGKLFFGFGLLAVHPPQLAPRPLPWRCVMKFLSTFVHALQFACR